MITSVLNVSDKGVEDRNGKNTMLMVMMVMMVMMLVVMSVDDGEDVCGDGDDI